MPPLLNATLIPIGILQTLARNVPVAERTGPGILLEVSEERASLSTLSLSFEMTLDAELVAVKVPGRVCLPWARVLGLLRLPRASVLRIVASAGARSRIRTEVSHGSTRIAWTDEPSVVRCSDAPLGDPSVRFEVPEFVLVESLRAVRPSVCEDPTREKLCGVFFEGTDRDPHVVATNGHTLAHDTPPWDTRRRPTDLGDPKALLPARLCDALCKRTLRPSTARVVVVTGTPVPGDTDSWYWRAHTPTWSVGALGVAPGNFPSWRQVVPTVRAEGIRIQAAQLLAGLACLRCRTVALCLVNGVLEVMDADDPENDIAVTCASVRAPDFKIRVRLSYLRNAVVSLRQHSPVLELCVETSLDPILLRAGEDRYVLIMPMRQ